MNVNELVTQIDAEIQRLQQARALLSGDSVHRGPGRPRKTASSDGLHAAATKRQGKRKKRVLSPEARARIAAAQRKRWAAQKKQG